VTIAGPFNTTREQELARALGRSAAEYHETQEALEAALRERDAARVALSEADHRRDEFLATLAHELRNPLAPIRSAVQIMRMAEGDQATVAAARSMIERQLKHLVRLIDDLMDASRITRGKLELRRERVDLAAVIQIAVETNRSLLESKQQHLRLDLPADSLFVEADTTRLAQVFSNLLHNSAKFSDTRADISVRAVREGTQAVVTVTDSGIGIESGMLAQVFDMFTQLERSQWAPHDGLGVGLTLVKRLVELHGGTVSAHSDGVGKGSTFVVRLDLADATESRVTLPAAALQAGEGHTRARILIADDNHDAAQSLALMLGMEGHDVRTAGDGIEALKVAEEFHPQVALLDIGMPKMDGYETARRLKTRPWARHTLLFAQTGWGQEDHRQRAKEAGFHQHLVKPLDPEALIQLLDAVLPIASD
jgi:signal transduction histidine kinase/CheY-like chemotaxis protein